MLLWPCTCLSGDVVVTINLNQTGLTLQRFNSICTSIEADKHISCIDSVEAALYLLKQHPDILQG